MLSLFIFLMSSKQSLLKRVPNLVTSTGRDTLVFFRLDNVYHSTRNFANVFLRILKLLREAFFRK
jgi:hypothetical protein